MLFLHFPPLCTIVYTCYSWYIFLNGHLEEIIEIIVFGKLMQCWSVTAFKRLLLTIANSLHILMIINIFFCIYGLLRYQIVKKVYLQFRKRKKTVKALSAQHRNRKMEGVYFDLFWDNALSVTRSEPTMDKPWSS